METNACFCIRKDCDCEKCRDKTYFEEQYNWNEYGDKVEAKRTIVGIVKEIE